MALSFFLVGSRRLLLDGLRALLEQQRDWRVAGEAPDAQTALQALARTQGTDILLAEVALDGVDGTLLAEEVVQRWPRAKVILLADRASPEMVQRAFAGHALGFFVTTRGFSDLRAAVDAVRQGRMHPCPEAGAALARRLNRGDSAVAGPRWKTLLTTAERKVLMLIGQGESSKEIASRLTVSLRTIDTHRRNAKRKLGARSHAQFIQLAVRYAFPAFSGGGGGQRSRLLVAGRYRAPEAWFPTQARRCRNGMAMGL